MKMSNLKGLFRETAEFVGTTRRKLGGNLLNIAFSLGGASAVGPDLDFNELATSVAHCSPAMALDLIRQMDQYQALLQQFSDLPAESY